MDGYDCKKRILYDHLTYLADSRKTSILSRKTHVRMRVVDTPTRKSLQLGSWLLRRNLFRRRFHGSGRRHDTTGDPCCFFQDSNVGILPVYALHIRGSHTLLDQAYFIHGRLVCTRECVMHLLCREKWELRANFEKDTFGSCWIGEMIN